MKRENYLSWDDFFMYSALLAAQRSKDPDTQVGACIVNKENKIIGIGYNGLPNGCSDDFFSWNKPEAYKFIAHAELNSITNCVDRAELKNSVMYSTLFPCNECAKLIIQSGISKIYYLFDYRIIESVVASKKMFDAAGVVYEKLELKTKELKLGCV